MLFITRIQKVSWFIGLYLASLAVVGFLMFGLRYLVNLLQ